jgi:hypothetical protein
LRLSRVGRRRIAFDELGRQWGGSVAALAVGGRPAGLLAATPAGVLRAAPGEGWSGAAAPANAPLASALAVAPDDPAVLLAAGGAGVHRSADGGVSWRLALEAEGAGAVAALSAAEALAGTAGDGVFRTDDGGRTWQPANAGLLDLDVLALAVVAADGRDALVLAGTASGLQASRNGGRSWLPVELPVADPAVGLLAAGGGGRVVVATEADGLLASADGGVSWTVLPAPDEPASALALDATGRRLALACGERVFLAADGGPWRSLPALPAPALALVFAPAAEGPRLLAGLVGRGVVALEASGGWAERAAGLAGRLPAWLALSPNFAADRTLLCLDVDGSLLVAEDGGRSWTARAALHSLVPHAVLASSRHALLAVGNGGYALSGDGGTSWRPVDGGAPPCLACAAPGATAGFLLADATGALAVLDATSARLRPLAAAPGGTPRALAAADGRLFLATAVAGQGLRLWRRSVADMAWANTAPANTALADTAWECLLEAPPAARILLAAGAGLVVAVLDREVLIADGAGAEPGWRRAALDPAVPAPVALAIAPGAAGPAIGLATAAGLVVADAVAGTFVLGAPATARAALSALTAAPPADGIATFVAASPGGTVWRIRVEPGGVA